MARDALKAVADSAGIDISPYRLVAAEHSHHSAELAVARERDQVPSARRAHARERALAVAAIAREAIAAATTRARSTLAGSSSHVAARSSKLVTLGPLVIAGRGRLARRR